MYLVPMEIPKYCNKCPFGMCHYIYPVHGIIKCKGEKDNIDGEDNADGTYGYICNVEYQKNNRYTKVLRANIGKDIERPEWCGLKEVKRKC